MEMAEIECIDLFGQVRFVPRDKVILRPAAYAIILHRGKALLLKMRATGKYHLPGGGIEAGEPVEATLKRELREEAGIEIEVSELVHFEEVFFYYNPSGKAYHGLHFYYLCKPVTYELLDEDEVMDGSAEKPSWIPLQNIREQDFQIHGDTILALCRQAAESTPLCSRS